MGQSYSAVPSNKIDQFNLLPDEKIEEICTILDNKSLSRFMETSKRIHSVCYDVYLKRQKEYELSPFINIFNKLKNWEGTKNSLRQIYRTMGLYGDVIRLCEDGKCSQEVSDYMNNLIDTTIADIELRRDMKFVFRDLFDKFPPRNF